MTALSVFSALLLLAVGAGGLWGIWSGSRSMELVVSRYGAAEASASSAWAESLMLRRFEKDMFLNVEDLDKVKEYKKKHDAAMVALKGDLDALEPLLLDPKEVKKVGEMRASLLVYEQVVHDIYVRMLSHDILHPTQGNLAMAPYKSHVRVVGMVSEHLSAAASERMRRAEEEWMARSARLEGFILVFGLVAVALGLLISRTVGNKIARRVLETMKVLEKVASGQLEQRASVEGGDEIARMNAALNQAIANTRDAKAEIEKSNASMRLVMDNVDQGFLTLGRRGTLASAHSAILEQWFGVPGERETFPAYIGRSCPEFAAWFELGWEDLIGGYMPADLCIEQLPAKFSVQDHTYALEYTLIPAGSDAENFEQCLVVISDITTEVESERMQEEQRETVEVFQRLFKDREGFMMFLASSEGLMEEIEREEDPLALKCQVHTLKGNMRIFGIQSIARRCHEIEEGIDELGGVLDEAELLSLRDSLARLKEQACYFLDHGRDAQVLVSERELLETTRSLLKGSSREDLAARMLSWRLLETNARPRVV